MDTIERIRQLCSDGVFCNTPDTALPQTAVADIMRRHLSAEGGKKKKILVWGIDGVRADCVPCIFTNGAVSQLKESGDIYLSYAGGDPSRPETLQKTCTWQGWAAIQTGKWGIDNGVVEFTTLRRDCPTVLMEAARKGYHCVFSVVWPDHLTVTYKDEVEMAKNENLAFEHILSPDDEHMHKSVTAAIDSGCDIVFCIFENTDHMGHTSGFSRDNENYTSAIRLADSYALDAIRHARKREAVYDEDWLIIVTTDHGGHDCTHFDHSPDDKFTFIAVNKKIQDLP